MWFGCSGPGVLRRGSLTGTTVPVYVVKVKLPNVIIGGPLWLVGLVGLYM